MEMQRNAHWDWEAEHICCNLRPLSIFRGCPLNANAMQIFLKLFANSETKRNVNEVYVWKGGGGTGGTLNGTSSRNESTND